jgi:hypothetical protein
MFNSSNKNRQVYAIMHEGMQNLMNTTVLKQALQENVYTKAARLRSASYEEVENKLQRSRRTNRNRA